MANGCWFSFVGVVPQLHFPIAHKQGAICKQRKRYTDKWNKCWKSCQQQAEPKLELDVTALEKSRAKYFREKRKLEQVVQSKRLEDVAQVRETIEQVTAQDPLFLLERKRKQYETLKLKGNNDEAQQVWKEIKWLKVRMPQFRLGGLWAGKTSQQSVETIHIHYQDVTLFAVKTSETEQGIAKGEIAFRCDISVDSLVDPEAPGSDLLRLGLERVIPNLGGIQRFNAEAQILVPVATGTEAEKPSFQQVAGKVPLMPQWTPGELIVIDERQIVFVWLTLGQYILFEKREEL
ncbi:uncharacterized protein Gasu_20580 [Galdieria sulphuraria]|uniref:Uncharacterized protein n=1 Tax=Galdieria sulphuraria TaxID=130081 RepID=M2W4B4_GALSU|nr:uncharacterized protein Gasu_20580 [Galdieria sulphuraria]EME30596.1 hypothetical protein Gasu_20580 [Galdieria sulphuraria]|eukprot:XP_005707116.1 hypothetical protein Gasu_20580 [Galdieria sulphuraria]